MDIASRTRTNQFRFCLMKEVQAFIKNRGGTTDEAVAALFLTIQDMDYDAGVIDEMARELDRRQQ